MQQLQKGQVGGSGLWPYVQQSAHLKKIKIAHNSKSQKASYVAMKISGKTNHWQAEVPSLCSFMIKIHVRSTIPVISLKYIPNHGEANS